MATLENLTRKNSFQSNILVTLFLAGSMILVLYDMLIAIKIPQSGLVTQPYKAYLFARP